VSNDDAGAPSPSLVQGLLHNLSKIHNRNLSQIKTHTDTK
jgi:hypothetical protein